jgi:hypothetical protein
MIQMIALEMPEVAIAGLSEMQEIVEPFFADIALHDTGEQGRERVNRKEKAERR